MVAIRFRQRKFQNPLLDVSKKVLKKLPHRGCHAHGGTADYFACFVLAMKLDKNDNGLHVQVGEHPKPLTSSKSLLRSVPPVSFACEKGVVGSVS